VKAFLETRVALESIYNIEHGPRPLTKKKVAPHSIYKAQNCLIDRSKWRHIPQKQDTHEKKPVAPHSIYKPKNCLTDGGGGAKFQERRPFSERRVAPETFYRLVNGPIEVHKQGEKKVVLVQIYKGQLHVIDSE
jgi:hypothetical protein